MVRVRTFFVGLVALGVAVILAAITVVGWEVVLGPRARPVTNLVYEPTPARLERGRYLTEHVAACFHCHSPHDLTDQSYPMVPGTKASGWDMPIPELGRIVSKNLTPDRETGLGAWTDDEIGRAIREGVRRDGSALFPIMPYLAFASMTDEDLASVVVYLRTLTPIRNELPDRELIFPLNLLVNTMPAPVTEPRPSVPSATPVERGKYLATLAGCPVCHTPTDTQGQPLPNMLFAGGEYFTDPATNGRVHSANLTPDPSGIPHYDEAMFIQTIRTGRLAGRLLNHIMPFDQFSGMTDQDLADIFAFLRAQVPVRHRVSNTDPPTPCPVCLRSHGLGDLNAVPAR